MKFRKFTMVSAMVISSAIVPMILAAPAHAIDTPLVLIGGPADVGLLIQIGTAAGSVTCSQAPTVHGETSPDRNNIVYSTHYVDCSSSQNLPALISVDAILVHANTGGQFSDGRTNCNATTCSDIYSPLNGRCGAPCSNQTWYTHGFAQIITNSPVTSTSRGCYKFDTYEVRCAADSQAITFGP